jgi:hypothetical protein
MAPLPTKPAWVTVSWGVVSLENGGGPVTIERDDTGGTPLGGAYTLTVYTDADGKETDKSVATQALVSEYSADDKWLGETVLRFE